MKILIKKFLLRAAKKRAKDNNLEFNIDLSDITIPNKCPLLNIPLNKHYGEGTAKEDSPSIEKIIPSLGYTKGNIWIISNKANTIKNNASLSDLILLVNNLKLKFDELNLDYNLK